MLEQFLAKMNEIADFQNESGRNGTSINGTKNTSDLLQQNLRKTKCKLSIWHYMYLKSSYVVSQLDLRIKNGEKHKFK